MIDIVVCGKNKNSQIDKLIINNFSGLNYVSINQSDNIPAFNTVNPIIIFKNSFTQKLNNSPIPHKAICILNPENEFAINILSEQNIPAISCGMSGRDTFSLSSINFPKISLSLQRQIFSVNDICIEPQEFVINVKKNYEPYSIMATCATILLVYSSINSNTLF